MARANTELKHHRSSVEPPPRQTRIRLERAPAAPRRAAARSSASSLHLSGREYDPGGIISCACAAHPVQSCPLGRGDYSYPLRIAGKGPLSLSGANKPSLASFEGLKLQVAKSQALILLDAAGHQLHPALGAIDGHITVDQNVFAVIHLEVQSASVVWKRTQGRSGASLSFRVKYQKLGAVMYVLRPALGPEVMQAQVALQTAREIPTR